MLPRVIRKNRISIVIDDDLKAALEYYATDNQRTMSDFIRIVLQEYCDALAEQQVEETQQE